MSVECVFSMTTQCSHRRAEDDEEIQHQWIACCQRPPCPGGWNGMSSPVFSSLARSSKGRIRPEGH
jgi:hypothetical protein